MSGEPARDHRDLPADSYWNSTPELQARFDKLCHDCDQAQRDLNRWARRTGFWEVLKLVWKSVIHMGMFSSDPQVSKDAMIITGMQTYRENREQHQRERLEDEMRQMANARTQGAAMADAFADRLEERGLGGLS